MGYSPIQTLERGGRKGHAEGAGTDKNKRKCFKMEGVENEDEN